MKKTLLLMSCLCFDLSAGIEKINVVKNTLIGFMQSKEKSHQNQQTLASSPSSVSFLEQFLQASSEHKESELDLKQNGLMSEENIFLNEAPRFSKLILRRPVSLERQASLERKASHLELSGFIAARHSDDTMFRVHSSQLNFKDFGKKIEQDCPVPTPSKDCVIGSPSPVTPKDCPVPTPSKDCVVASSSPVTQPRDSSVKPRSYSNSSDDFFLGSVSIDSPRKNSSRSLSGCQSYGNLDLDSFSPKK